MKMNAKRQVWSPQSDHSYVLRRIQRADARNRRTLRVFAKWLADSRNLSSASIKVRIDPASTFVDAITARAGCSCAPAFRSITLREIEEFFVEYGKANAMGSRANMRTAMRSFLEFASSRGWIPREMKDAVPSLVGYRLSGLPRGVSEEHLSKMLSTPWKNSQCLRRDRAIIWLLATYGVRRSQVCALQLKDIDWPRRTIFFAAHKGGKAVEHVLTQAVAQALADYLHEERPRNDSDFVFLRQRRPHVRLGPAAISMVVRARMRCCGLPPVGPHALRHAFATRLLRAGQPLKAVADLLGHRSLANVAVYAKVDYARLVECAVDWPEVTS